MVIAGANQEVGSHRDEVERQIVKLRRDVDEGPAVTLGKLGGQLKVEIGPGRASGEYDVLLVTFDKPHLTEVALGENRGRRLTNANGVRVLERLGTWQGKAVDFVVPIAGRAGRSDEQTSELQSLKRYTYDVFCF